MKKKFFVPLLALAVSFLFTGAVYATELPEYSLIYPEDRPPEQVTPVDYDITDYHIIDYREEADTENPEVTPVPIATPVPEPTEVPVSEEPVSEESVSEEPEAVVSEEPIATPVPTPTPVIEKDNPQTLDAFDLFGKLMLITVLSYILVRVTRKRLQNA